MALSEEKIQKLKALAERGVGGERDNARAILERNGIKWDEPQPQAKKGTGTGSGPQQQRTYRPGGYSTGKRRASDDFSDFVDGFWNETKQDKKERPNLRDDPFFNRNLRIPGVNSDFKLTVLSVIVSKLYGPNWQITYDNMQEYAHIPGLGEVEHSVIKDSYQRNYSRLVDAAKHAMTNTTLY